MRCATCGTTYEDFDACPECAKREEKRAASVHANVWRITVMVAISTVLAVIAGCSAFVR